ncbi:MAG: hypothetical protein KAS39_02220, partial [Actinomycetia bacterium]|nr:hypothetical protein [Actinomycetes bacterium]
GIRFIHPGDYSRIDILRITGRDTVILIAGTGVILVIAALVETYLSPSLYLSGGFKIAIGIVIFFVFIYYIYHFTTRGNEQLLDGKKR